MGIVLGELTNSYPIGNLVGATWSTINKTGQEILNAVKAQNSNHDSFALIGGQYPTSGHVTNGYSIFGFKAKVKQDNSMYFADNHANNSQGQSGAVIGDTGFAIKNGYYERYAQEEIRCNNGSFSYGGAISLASIPLYGETYYYKSGYSAGTITDCVIYIPHDRYVYNNNQPLAEYELFRGKNRNGTTIRLVSSFPYDPIIDNTSSAVYVEYTSKKFYNSAVIIANTGGSYTYTIGSIILRNPIRFFSEYWTTTGGGHWQTGSAMGYDYNNGYYAVGGGSRSETPSGINYFFMDDMTEITYSAVPIFTDVTAYNNYVLNPYVPYNWQSVSSIGSHLLSSILNINNGNPVNNVSAQGNLNLVSQTEVDSLISEVALDMSKVKVTYSIPSGTYSYIKLVYKRGSKPTSVSDGTAITITQASTEQIIDGIADGGTYWFVIFTDISRSNAMSIETEAVPMILWDKDLGVKHPMCSDYVSVKKNYDAYLWEFIDTYRLVGSGSNTPPGAGNTSITFQKGIKRKYATKMYIEIQCSRSYTLQWANSAMRLADTKTATGALPSGYLRVNFVSGNSGGVTDNYTHTTPYYTLPKMLIEIDISSVGADTMWYLAFWKCNEYTEITKCYFDAPVEIES